MANHFSALKRARQTTKRTATNRSNTSRLRTALVERDLTEEECERLRIAMSKANAAASAHFGSDRKGKPD